MNKNLKRKFATVFAAAIVAGSALNYNVGAFSYKKTINGHKVFKQVKKEDKLVTVKILFEYKNGNGKKAREIKEVAKYNMFKGHDFGEQLTYFETHGTLSKSLRNKNYNFVGWKIGDEDDVYTTDVLKDTIALKNMETTYKNHKEKAIYLVAHFEKKKPVSKVIRPSRNTHRPEVIYLTLNGSHISEKAE